MSGRQWVELIVFVVLFGGVTVLGFMAARWRRSATLDHLDEWGLGGRTFGSWITWFLLGGDLYTAYTFVAVPALIAAQGAYGFFALPYTVITYPLVFLPVLRLWSVSRARGYVTPADFVRGRTGSPVLALLIALTGVLATMPYIALQLVGLEAVLRTAGLNAGGLLGHLPLFIAFVILALYTFRSGLRAPALIAFAKDALIYLVIIVAVIYLPIKLGGWSHVFDQAQAKLTTPSPTTGKPAGSVLLSTANASGYWTIALGSALALFLYPHSVTGVLASRSRKVIKRNMAALPAYSFLLGLLALLGYLAIAGGIKPLINGATHKADANTIIPSLFDHEFPSWFAGIAFAAIGIGALVPAAIMSIAAANLWTRNVYKEFIARDATPKAEARQAKIASLVVKFGALVFVLFVDPQYAVDLQTIGGVIILQTLPAVVIGLYTRWCHKYALIAGWVVGMVYAFWALWQIPNPASGHLHFGGSQIPFAKLSLLGWHPWHSTDVVYVGFVTLIVNLFVVVVLTFVLRAAKVFNGTDDTNPADYTADDGDPKLRTIATH